MKLELVFPQLPYYLTVSMIVGNDTVTVEIESTLHVEKLIKMPNSWHVLFVNSRPNGFREDVLNFIVKAYGLKLDEAKYS